MAHSVDSLVTSIIETLKLRGSEEIERTVPTHDTCLQYNGMCEGSCDGCKQFIPVHWKDHVYFNGEWWS